MRNEYQIEKNRVRNKKAYYIYREKKEAILYAQALEEVRIRNRDIAFMNEVRNVVQNILSR